MTLNNCGSYNQKIHRVVGANIGAALFFCGGGAATVWNFFRWIHGDSHALFGIGMGAFFMLVSGLGLIQNEAHYRKRLLLNEEQTPEKSSDKGYTGPDLLNDPSYSSISIIIYHKDDGH